MNIKVLIAFLFFARSHFAQTDQQWVLAQSTLTYHVSHPLHQVEAVSHAARGKGVCHAGQCDFLIAVPVKSFDSGDSNRDLHMLQVVRGAEFPWLPSARGFPRTSSVSSMIHADLEIQFAGQTAEYKQVPLQLAKESENIRITGTIPATFADFKIDPPSLFAMPIKNEIPVRIDMTWHERKVIQPGRLARHGRESFGNPFPSSAVRSVSLTDINNSIRSVPGRRWPHTEG